MNLTDATILILDCQATGSSPENADVIEMGWVPFRIENAVSPDQVSPNTHLIKPDAEVEIPHRVQELTGLSNDMLSSGDPLRQVEKRFLESAEEADRLVAHYAQYERRFLKAETALRHPDRFHEQQFLCTHEIATRLFPDLPRRSLRAMAGYFGHSTPDPKRVTPHIRATAVIWKHLVDVLEETEDIDTLDELESWLERTSGQRSGNGYTYPISRERRLSLPDKPGTYHMVDQNNRILYIGKATSLKDRVNSYFQSGKQLSNRKLELVSRVQNVECNPETTPLEAALRENDEIKDHDPPYNESLTAGNRHILYSDVTFTEFHSKQNDTYPIGPFSRQKRIKTLGILLQLLRGNPVSDTLQQQPRLKSLFAEPAFSDAVELVRKRRGLTDRRNEQIPQTLLLSLGKTLWIEKQNRSDANEKEDRNEQPQNESTTALNPTDEHKHRTPEELADRIESMLRQGTRDVRRARWYDEIATSKLSWQPRCFDEPHWRTIHLKHGQIEHRATTPTRPDEPPPEPDPSANPIPSSVTLHDRLRVFTTALKQLIKQDGNPVLETGYGTTLNQSDLDTVLWWM